MSGGVRVEGLNRLVRELTALGLDVDDLKGIFAEISREGARRAAAFAPRRTGALAASIRGNRAKNKAVVTAGRARVRYAAVVNYGRPSSNTPASGFMQRADAAMQPRALRMLDTGIQAAIRRRNL